MKFKAFIFLFPFIFFVNVSLTQSISNNHLIEENPLNSNSLNRFGSIDTSGYCDIMLTTGILLKEVNIIGVDDSTFTITKSEVDRVFPISQLHKITFIKNGFWPGFAVGAGGSVALWTLLGIASSSNDKRAIESGLMVGLLLAVPTGLITGLISEFAGKDEEYNFGKMDVNVKAKRLKFLLLKNK